jgi:FkbH-like protein
MPWSESVLMPLAHEHVRHLLAARGGRARSCLVVGLDNTLWRGRVAEDGAAGGVELGARAPGNAFLLFQHQLDRLRRSGVQLAICSKADCDAAVALLETHPDMLLRLSHFAATRIGCASKPACVREIAAELGIGLDSVVFWDDSSDERAQMRAELPQVLTPEVPLDPAMHRQALIDLAVFDLIDLRERR